MAAIVFRDKSLRSPSSFGHGDWEVDIWMMSNFSCFWGQKSALGLHLVMKTEKERSVLLLFDFSVAYFLFVLPPYSSIRQFVLCMGVSALHSWHGVLGNVFPWKMGL